MRIVHLTNVVNDKPKRLSKAERELISAKNWLIRQRAKDKRKAEAMYRDIKATLQQQ